MGQRARLQGRLRVQRYLRGLKVSLMGHQSDSRGFQSALATTLATVSYPHHSESSSPLPPSGLFGMQPRVGLAETRSRAAGRETGGLLLEGQWAVVGAWRAKTFRGLGKRGYSDARIGGQRLGKKGYSDARIGGEGALLQNGGDARTHALGCWGTAAASEHLWSRCVFS